MNAKQLENLDMKISEKLKAKNKHRYSVLIRTNAELWSVKKKAIIKFCEGNDFDYFKEDSEGKISTTIPDNLVFEVTDIMTTNRAEYSRMLRLTVRIGSGAASYKTIYALSKKPKFERIVI